MKQDISDREDLIRLINGFYEKVRKDETIGYLFEEVARVKWEKHLPVMYDFWEGILFQTGSYKGNPMRAHFRLHMLSPLQPEHFTQWVRLFRQNADELFAGEMTEQVKQKAESIATTMRIKILHGGISAPQDSRSGKLQ